MPIKRSRAMNVRDIFCGIVSRRWASAGGGGGSGSGSGASIANHSGKVEMLTPPPAGVPSTRRFLSSSDGGITDLTPPTTMLLTKTAARSGTVAGQFRRQLADLMSQIQVQPLTSPVSSCSHRRVLSQGVLLT